MRISLVPSPIVTALFASLLVLSGCGHSLYIVGRTSGATGTAHIVTAGNHSGEISIALKGKTYSGHWVYAPGGGSISVGTATAVSGTQSATATATAIGLPMGGPGSIIASAPDGSSLRCSFDYSEFGSTGIGICQDGEGETYDLQIN